MKWEKVLVVQYIFFLSITALLHDTIMAVLEKFSSDIRKCCSYIRAWPTAASKWKVSVAETFNV